MSLGKKELACNTALLTAVSVVMRALGTLWQAWLANRAGAEAVGLYGLVMSVAFLFGTLALGGARFSVTRLLSEELGREREGSTGPVMLRACAWALGCGCLAAAVLRAFAGAVGTGWIADGRTVPALRFLALGLPAGALSATVAGYFTAVGRVWKSAAEQLAEQLFRMAVSGFLLRRAGTADPGAVCAALALAGTAADYLGVWIMGILYALDRRSRDHSGRAGPRLTRRLLCLALPVWASALARNALGMLRQLMVPKGLRSSGLSAAAALSGYGVVNGMAMPLLLFPACLPGALAELLVPALTRLQAGGETAALRRRVRLLLRGTVFLSLGVSAAFFLAADALGGLLYRSREAAHYIRILSPMAVFMYTDIVTDGCLKGLGEMMRSMAYNLTEALLGLAMSWLLLPRLALKGYIITLYVCEIFNFSLSLGRLLKITGCRNILRQPGQSGIQNTIEAP